MRRATVPAHTAVRAIGGPRGAWRRLRAAALAGGLALGGSVFAADPDRDELEALHAEIVKLIGPATCTNLVHCRALALGTRPCGGPAEYLAYSSFGNNRDVLESKAFEYTLLHEEIQRKEKAAGACVVLPAPRLQCVDRHCRVEHGP